ncbi:Serpentine Receptor, class J [Caenorhabditis elegans]|uniref:Serpentine Receptor, class J n=1 Tax=Caenorhabditis elegans TaxID=6239 RepID=Q9XTR3_CAEEL|nr:Serpentine Receptor, class J [Caenorhabditis elegans]CAB16551.2 Serpentine Receptor, class J [Caenorhabditis elegans]|eukprot:NP_507604.1 Serpentine Receptor, class J [Caenorhabditis elegans]
MYLNWAHHYIPKIGGVFSIIINLLFIFIAHDDKHVHFGNYRFLLIFFGIYNLLCTVVDLIVPTCVIDYNYAFSYYVVDGYFEKTSPYAPFVLCLRSSIISAGYGVLHAHFVYRYLVLFNQQLLNTYFLPYGLLLSVAHCFLLTSAWTFSAYLLLVPEPERRFYMAQVISEVLSQNVHEMNILIAVYEDLSPKVTWNSRLGVFLVSIISILSVLIYILFSILIVSKLRSTDLALSQKTKRLQKQLAKSLAVQATIPLIVDLFPCFFVWYMPIFKVNIGYWTYWFASIFISFFPVFDPLAMFYFLPVFRVRLRQILRMKERPARVSAMTHTDISRFF